MARSPFSIIQSPVAPKKALPDPLEVELPTGQGLSDEVKDGVRRTELADGTVVIDLNPVLNKKKSDRFNGNLADDMEDGELGRIASELLQGIEADNQSRQEWLETHAQGIKLLGLVIEESRGEVGASSAPLEGMSTVRHPLLLQACLAFQATARGELLPAAGPVKVRDDLPEQSQDMPGYSPPSAMGAPGMPFAPPSAPPSGMGVPEQSVPGGSPAPPMQPPMGANVPMPPPGPQGPPMPPQMMGHNGGPPMDIPEAAMAMAMPPPMQGEPPKSDRELLADALEKDFNHYLTTTAKEYTPDTDQMLFKLGFGGLGVKKVYNCPLRRRPVSESVPVEDFIVSNALTELGNARRITHQIKMRPSVLRRMQIAGVYRDITIGMPTDNGSPTPIDQAKAEVVGVTVQPQDPKDQDHIIYECYCELLLNDYAPRQFKDKGLALPYRVTIEKTSQKVLEIRRNWNESDKECMAKEFFVEFPFVRGGFGFYGIGLLHILGNTTKTLTAVWREIIDAGMFANFPGFIYAKGAGRQLTNQFRVPPGGGIPMDVGLQDIRQAIMPLPYKEVGPSFVAFMTQVEQNGQQLGGTAQIAVGEGKQDAPVGTTLALIEQATKPTGAVLKRLHASQGKEFQLLKDRFKENPEAFWRFNPRPAMQWQKDQFIEALEDFDLVPVSDPNNPTSLHRAAKAMTLMQMGANNPLFDQKKLYTQVAKQTEIGDITDLFAPDQPQDQGPPVDPHKMADLSIKAQGQQAQAQSRMADSQIKAQVAAMNIQDKVADRASKEHIAQLNLDTERLRLASTLAIHSDSTEAAQHALQMRLDSDHLKHASALASDHILAAANAQQAPEVEIPQ